MLKKILLILLISPVLVFSQIRSNLVSTKNNQRESPSQKLKVKAVDSNATEKMMLIDDEMVDAIDLDEVFIVGPYRFKNRDERRQYLILKRKTKKVWPYAVLASQRLVELNERLNKIESNSKRRKYTKIVQNYIEDEFTEELKKLTKTEGQILVKLMYRQTGVTTFDIVKDLKSGWRAFWYNTTASLFNISLKEEYNPQDVREDYLIEHILRRSFQNNTLDKQDAAITIDFISASSKWK